MSKHAVDLTCRPLSLLITLIILGCGQATNPKVELPTCDEIAAGLVTSCADPDPKDPPSEPDPEETWAGLHEFHPSVSTYGSCADLGSALGSGGNRGHWRRSPGREWFDPEVVINDAESAKAPAQSSKVTQTNRQEQGVDEADRVKFMGTYALVAQPHQMIVLNTETLEITDQRDHDLPNLGEPEPTLEVRLTRSVPWRPSSSLTNADVQLYVHDNQIVQLLQWRRYYVQDTRVRIRVFTLDAEGKLNLVRESWQQGTLESSRLLAGQLYMVVNRDISSDYESDLDGLTCGDFAEAPVSLQRQDLVRISRLDLGRPDAEFENLALPGRADELYMSERNLYITQKLYYIHDVDAKYDYGRQTTVVTKIGLGEKLQVQGVGEFPGHLKDQWALKEILNDQGEEFLVAATTRRFGWSDRAQPQENYLWVLSERDQILETVGSVSPYGVDENIRAVRYIGNKVYVVTFRTTDPLFGFSLANPRDPQIIDELKIPGFSQYLHPAGENRLIGVGFEAFEENGVVRGPKVSLFDISDGGFRELDSKSFGERGSWSEATDNHHAFYWDATNQEFAIPLVEIQRATDNWANPYQLAFSGAVVLGIDGDRLVERARLSHSAWLPESCKLELGRGKWWAGVHASYDINRIFRIGDELLTFSRYGLRTFDRSSGFQQLRERIFATNHSRSYQCDER